MRTTPALLAASTLAVVGLATLTGCSSSSDSPSTPATSVVASAAASDGTPGSAEMMALCDQMVADGLSADDATALAESNGFVARIGTIDGQPQALTMDFREDRFTFEVEGDVVVGCTYG
jgi:hypothetical protein